MAVRRRDPIRSKTVIKKTHVQLSWILWRRQRCDKLIKCLQTTGIISWVLKPSAVQKQTRLWIYNASAIPTLIMAAQLHTSRTRQIQYHSSRWIFFGQKLQNMLSDQKNKKNILAEWTAPEAHRLLWTINQQDIGTQKAHSRVFWIVIWRPEQAMSLKSLKAWWWWQQPTTE